MPEGLFKKPLIVDRLESSKHLWLNRDIAAREAAFRFARDFYSELEPDIELLGAGADHIVTTKPGDNQKTVSYEHKTVFGFDTVHPLHRHEQYQMQKLFHLLFPNNFPDIYAAISGKDPHFVKQRINSKAGEVNRDFSSFLGIIEECRLIGVPLSIDPNPENFLEADDGSVYYVDDILTPNHHNNFNRINEEQLADFFTRHHTPEKSIAEIKKCLRRLREYRVINGVFEEFDFGGRLSDIPQRVLTEEDIDLNNTEDREMLGRARKFIKALARYLGQDGS